MIWLSNFQGKSNTSRRAHLLIFLIGLCVGIICTRMLYRIKDINYVIKWNSQYRQFDSDDLLVSRIRNDSVGNRKLDQEELCKVDKKLRVLCFVLTKSENHEKKAKHVKATWGKRCDTLLFMSSEANNELPAIRIPVDGYRNLWGKVRESLVHIYKYYNGKYDWVLKADEDTFYFIRICKGSFGSYHAISCIATKNKRSICEINPTAPKQFVIMENLRYMLSVYDPDQPFFLGCRYRAYVKQGYPQGGAGYIISKEAVRKFVVEGVNNQKCSTEDKGAEDVQISKCFEVIGISLNDTRDHFGRQKFLPYNVERYFNPYQANNRGLWRGHWIAFYYPPISKYDAQNCCSNRAISFHKIRTAQLYVLDYLLYGLRPLGIYRSYPRNIVYPPLGAERPTLIKSSSTCRGFHAISDNITKRKNILLQV